MTVMDSDRIASLEAWIVTAEKYHHTTITLPMDEMKELLALAKTALVEAS